MQTYSTKKTIRLSTIFSRRQPTFTTRYPPLACHDILLLPLLQVLTQRLATPSHQSHLAVESTVHLADSTLVPANTALRFRMNKMIRVTCSALRFSAAISIDVRFLVILQKGSHISVDQSASITVTPHCCTRYRLDACLKTGNSCRIVHSILKFRAILSLVFRLYSQ